MSKEYDVIVCGGGNGGLAAAARLAKAGYRILLIEQHNIPGGCATSFVRGRFEFESALHELCFVGTDGTPGFVYKMFDELGIDIDWKFDPNMFRAIVKGDDGFDVVVRGGDAFVDSIEEAVPGSGEHVQALLDIADNVNETLDYMEKVNNKPNVFSVFAKHRNFLRSSSHSLTEVEDALEIPEKAKNIINSYWSYLGAIPEELNAMHYMNMLKSYIDYGAAMPSGRSHELAEGLMTSIRENGGEVWTGCKVTRVITNARGRAIGVEVDDGEDGEAADKQGGIKKILHPLEKHTAKGRAVYAKEIISNIIPHNVFSMMNRLHIPVKDIKLANARKIALSAFTIYLGLDANADELGIKDYTTIIMNDAGPKVQIRDGGFYIVNCLNRTVPQASPEGTCMLFFTIMMFGSDFPKNIRPQDYKKYKNDMAEKYIRDYEELMHVDVMGHIEEIEVATPATFARYLSTPEGSVYGYQLSRWDGLMARYLRADAENAIPGLHFAGGHTKMGDGYSSAFKSGIDAADKVQTEIEKSRHKNTKAGGVGK